MSVARDSSPIQRADDEVEVEATLEETVGGAKDDTSCAVAATPSLAFSVLSVGLEQLLQVSLLEIGR